MLCTELSLSLILDLAVLNRLPLEITNRITSFAGMAERINMILHIARTGSCSLASRWTGMEVLKLSKDSATPWNGSTGYQEE